MPSLKWIAPEGQPRVFAIYKKVTSIGRGGASDVCIDSKSLAESHAQVVFDGRDFTVSVEAVADEAAIGNCGVVVYLRGHEGRGIGLANKIRAYQLQDEGLDTVDANTAQGFPVDARDYDVAAAILVDLGVRSVRLLSNNPRKAAGLERHGVAVAEMVRSDVVPTPESAAYLACKRDRLGHL